MGKKFCIQTLLNIKSHHQPLTFLLIHIFAHFINIYCMPTIHQVLHLALINSGEKNIQEYSSLRTYSLRVVSRVGDRNKMKDITSYSINI